MDYNIYIKAYEIAMNRKFNVEIINVNSIYQKSLELGDTTAGEDFDILNGRVIVPQKANEKYIILLNNKIFKNGTIDFVRTIFHEMTHVCDYMDLFIYLNITKSEDMNKWKYIIFYKLWSEFHASLLGNSVFINFASKSGIYEENDRLFHVSYELPEEIRYLDQMREKYNDDLTMQLYFYLLFFGKLYCWTQIHTDFYSEKAIRKILSYDDNIIELYNFCVNHRDFPSVINKIGTMETIIENTKL